MSYIISNDKYWVFVDHCTNYFMLIIRNQNKILELLRNKNIPLRKENNYLPELPCKTIEDYTEKIIA